MSERAQPLSRADQLRQVELSLAWTHAQLHLLQAEIDALTRLQFDMATAYRRLLDQAERDASAARTGPEGPGAA